MRFQERSLAQRMDRQLMAIAAHCTPCTAWRQCWHMKSRIHLARHFAARRDCSKRLTPDDRKMTQLIIAESDRIRNLIDRMESFGDTRGFTRHPVNIHEVLDRVRKVAESSFARGVNILEVFDPSLPGVG